MTPLPAARAAAPLGVAGRALGAVLGVVAHVRGGKPLHPRGIVLAGTLEVTGAAEATGVAWLDEPSTSAATARLSRSGGLPPPLPDVLGLAVRVESEGSPGDLLLSTTGSGTFTRFVLRPRRDAGRAFLGCLLPYAGPAGPLLLAARVLDPHLPARARDVAQALGMRPARVELLCAPLTGAWSRFGTLTLDRVVRHRGDLDPPVSFDPMRHPLPGLRPPAWHVALREPAYARARAATDRALGARDEAGTPP